MATAKKTINQEQEQQMDAPETKQTQAKAATAQKTYECWEVSVTKDRKLNEAQSDFEEVIVYHKKGDKPQSVTQLEPHQANALNEQSRNSKLRYYEVEQ